MLSIFGSVSAVTALTAVAAFDLVALSMYGLLGLLVGMIAWSKYNEPPLSDPYAVRQSARTTGTSSGARPSQGRGDVAADPIAAEVKAP